MSWSKLYNSIKGEYKSCICKCHVLCNLDLVSGVLGFEKKGIM